MKERKMNILFVCKYNRFRSRVAQAYFKKINKNLDLHVKSAGIIRGHAFNVVQARTAKTFGITLRGTPQGLSTNLLRWQDITVIVADDVPSGIFNNKKYHKKLIVWKIRDASNHNKKEVSRIIKQVMNKVDGFVRELR